MRPWSCPEHPRRRTTPSERHAIRTLADRGLTAPQIAAQLGWSVATVRKWRRCADPERVSESRLGRPPQGPLGAPNSRAERLRLQLRTWRTAHPGWGPKTLRAELARHPDWAQTPLPSRATVARFLQADGWIPARAQRQIQPARPGRPAPQAPHEEWQLDARGPSEVPSLGLVALVQLNDTYSHARLLSYPCLLGPGAAGRAPRQLQGADYQLVLRLAFCDWGLPDRLQVDHATVFCDPDSTSPYPTRLHLWLLALGVELGFTRVRRPTDQGLTERSHQLWAAQVLEGCTFQSGPELVRALRERREFLNGHLPCRSLGEQPPLVAYPSAQQPRRRYRPEYERLLLDPARIAAYLAGHRWERKLSHARTFRIGNQVYRVGREWTPGSLVRLEHHGTGPGAGTFQVRSEDGQHEQELAVRGCAPEDLLGDLTRLLAVPGFQPTLPFTWEEERVLRLSETLTATSS
jgi:hypothetical protein